MPLDYEIRLLAFVDILGWSDLIDRSTRDPIVHSFIRRAARSIRSMGEAVEQHAGWADLAFDPFSSDQAPPDLRFSHFSDTFVMTVPPDPEHALYLAHATAGLSRSMLKLSHYVRGSIVAGKIHHMGGMLYGPALVTAYQDEQRVVKYPRILVSPDVQKLLPADRYRADVDGLLYLNIYPPAPTMSRVEIRTLLHVAEQKRARDARRPELSDEKRNSLVEKHDWFIGHMNLLLSEIEGQRTA